MNIRITVRSGATTRDFVAKPRKSNLPSEFCLDTVDFYVRWGKAIPRGEHWELEIIEPHSSFFFENKLHIHMSRLTKNPFVFYPWQISTIARAQAIFRVWCLGSIGAVSRSLDFTAIYLQECGNDEAKFLQIMREKYDISVVEEKLDVE